MPLTICEYRGYRMSLLSSDAGHSALVHKSGVVLGFARSSRKEGLAVAFRKACAMIDRRTERTLVRARLWGSGARTSAA
jgi:hypothetical protein